MKKNLLLITFTLSCFIVEAQYRKMPLDTNHYWQQLYSSNVSPNPYSCYLKLKVLKDSVVNGKTYQFIKSLNNLCSPYYGSSGLVRQDTVLKRIIQLINNQEKILYNFNKNIGDTALLTAFGGTPLIYTLQSKDSLLSNDGLYHKRYKFYPNGFGFVTVIEGIGSTDGLLSPWVPFETGYLLECVARSHPSFTTIYSSSGLGTSCPIDVGLPLYREIKKTLSIFPNPSSSVINISIGNIIAESLEIKNTLGQTILRVNNVNQEITKVNISDFVQGVYFVKVYSGSSNATILFIKN